MLQGDRATLQTQAAIAERLTKQPRNSEFRGALDKDENANQIEGISKRERDIQLLDMEI